MAAGMAAVFRPARGGLFLMGSRTGQLSQKLGLGTKGTRRFEAREARQAHQNDGSDQQFSAGQATSR